MYLYDFKSRVKNNGKLNWNKHHVWSSRPSCPPQIQLKSQRMGAVLIRRMKYFQEPCLTKIAQNIKQYWNIFHGWSSRHSYPPQIQLKSKRMGAVLMRKMKYFQEPCLTKLAQNNIQYWNQVCIYIIKMLKISLFNLKLIIVSSVPTTRPF